MEHGIAYDKHYKFIFGSYIESHNDCKINNDMDDKTFSVFSWGPLQTSRGTMKYSPCAWSV